MRVSHLHRLTPIIFAPVPLWSSRSGMASSFATHHRAIGRETAKGDQTETAFGLAALADPAISATMVKTRSMEKGPDSPVRTAVRSGTDSSTLAATCKVCGEEMDNWSSTTLPVYTLQEASRIMP